MCQIDAKYIYRLYYIYIYIMNKKERSNYYKQWYEKNKEELKEKRKAYSERQLENATKYYWKNKETILEKNSKKKIETSIYYKQWYEKKKEKLNIEKFGEYAFNVKKYKKPKPIYEYNNNNSKYDYEKSDDKKIDYYIKPKSFLLFG